MDELVGTATGESIFSTHWGKREDGVLRCSCGWSTEREGKLGEIFFKRHAQIAWVAILNEGRIRRGQSPLIKPPPSTPTTKKSP